MFHAIRDFVEAVEVPLRDAFKSVSLISRGFSASHARDMSLANAVRVGWDWIGKEAWPSR